MRINARLDAESQRQLEYLVEATASDVLKASLAHYYSAIRANRPPRLTHLRAFVGKQGSGRNDLSVRAKELMADSIATKTSGQPAERLRNAK